MIGMLGMCMDLHAANALVLFQTSLTLAKLFASEALKNGNLAEGFRLVAECFWPLADVRGGCAMSVRFNHQAVKGWQSRIRFLT